MKLIPYGISDFDHVILNDYYFVDKSEYIQTVEQQSSYILFVRPRRMGKSLFLNMLMSYYDYGKTEQFKELFGNLWIGKHPTKEANRYIVLKFDFSQVEFDLETLEIQFRTYCINRISNLFDRYQNIFTKEEKEKVINQPSVKEAINTLIDFCRLKGYPTYLFIDEYDNFSNLILSARGVKAHEEITHGDGFYRNFFKACKGTFTRVFMTGVTPVTYDDLSSGFNIADVVTLLPKFDKTIGITETELRHMIDYYRVEGQIKFETDNIIAKMKPWYDNYCFSETCYEIEPPIYNTDMALLYIKRLMDFGNYPDKMIDYNAGTDYEKLNYLVMAEDLENRDRRMEIIKEICARGFIPGTVHEQFPAYRCGNETNFKSMLYYYGTLTFGGWNEEGDTILRITNKTMGELYLNYMLEVITKEGLNIDPKRDDLERTIGKAAINNDWEPMISKIAQLYHKYSGLKNTIRCEADVQGFLRGLLCLNKYYDVWPELELEGGYCDILLVPKNTLRCPTKYSFVIEIKYMKTDEKSSSSYIKEACRQLDKYVRDAHLENSHILRGTPLTKLYLVFKGIELEAYGEHK